MVFLFFFNSVTRSDMTSAFFSPNFSPHFRIFACVSMFKFSGPFPEDSVHLSTTAVFLLVILTVFPGACLISLQYPPPLLSRTFRVLKPPHNS